MGMTATLSLPPRSSGISTKFASSSPTTNPYRVATQRSVLASEGVCRLRRDDRPVCRPPLIVAPSAAVVTSRSSPRWSVSARAPPKWRPCASTTSTARGWYQATNSFDRSPSPRVMSPLAPGRMALSQCSSCRARDAGLTGCHSHPTWAPCPLRTFVGEVPSRQRAAHRRRRATGRTRSSPARPACFARARAILSPPDGPVLRASAPPQGSLGTTTATERSHGRQCATRAFRGTRLVARRNAIPVRHRPHRPAQPGRFRLARVPRPSTTNPDVRLGIHPGDRTRDKGPRYGRSSASVEYDQLVIAFRSQ